MLRTSHVACAAAWLWTTGGREGGLTDGVLAFTCTHKFSCYTSLSYDRYTFCSVILHVTGIQASPLRWFCGCQYFESTWCLINVFRMKFGVLTAVLLSSQVPWLVSLSLWVLTFRSRRCLNLQGEPKLWTRRQHISSKPREQPTQRPGVTSRTTNLHRYPYVKSGSNYTWGESVFFFRNVGNYSLRNTPSHPRRLES